MILYRTYPDSKLVELLNQLGSEGAFNELFRRYSPVVFKAAFGKLKSKELAEEIAQEIFIGIWNKRGKLDISNFQYYFKTATKYKVIDYIRTKVNQEKYWDYYKAFIPQTEEATDNKMAYDELMQAIDTKLETLSEKTKKVFYLNRLEGCSVREIAQKLSLSEKAIEYHLTRSLKELKLHLRSFLTFSFVTFSFLFF